MSSDHPRLRAGPAAEVPLDLALAERLLREQHPRLLEGELVVVGEGWDNLTVRIGVRLAMRIPRREVGARLIRHEQRWLPEVAPRLPVRVPVPIAVGVPSTTFPWPWSVVEWIEGETADRVPLDARAAETVAGVLTALHRPAPPEAPENPFRGVPLASRDEVVCERLARLELRSLEPIWQRALRAPAPAERNWIHGDLHPRNVLVRDGEIAAIIDWGDLCAGDAAADLACAWTLFDAKPRQALVDAYRPTKQQLERAAGWALNLATALLESGDGPHVRAGHEIVERLRTDGAVDRAAGSAG